MRKVLYTTSVVGFLCLALIPRVIVHCSSRPLADRKGRPSYVAGEMLVQLRHARPTSESPDEVAEQILPGRALGARIISDVGASSLYLMRVGYATTVQEAIAQAQRNPEVEFAEPNYYLYPSDIVPNDPLFAQEWDLLNTGTESFGGKAGADIEAAKAWDISTGSDDVVIAVVDTGIDFSHPDLAANVWLNSGEVAGNGVDDDNNGFVDDINGWDFVDNDNRLFDPNSDQGHGTHLSGTIGAVGNNGIGVAGVAWHVKLMGLKFIGLQKDGKYTGTTADAISAIHYATMEKMRGVNLRAINASWGGADPSKSLRKAIIKAGNAGILFVCAAGNAEVGAGSNMDDPNLAVYPAAWNDIPTLISVAASNNFDELAFFSNYGHATVSLAAPGTRIISTYPNRQYAILDGTSFATPHVSGVAALLAATEPSLRPADVKRRILSTAVPLPTLASKIQNSARLDAFNALTNHVPSAGPPMIVSITTDSKFVTVDGLGFVNSSAVIVVNGTPLRNMLYDSSYVIGDGTVTHLRAKVGKTLNTIFPLGQSVMVTVLNPNGQSSPPVPYTR